jgi:hypothetical protein
MIRGALGVACWDIYEQMLGDLCGSFLGMCSVAGF